MFNERCLGVIIWFYPTLIQITAQISNIFPGNAPDVFSNIILINQLTVSKESVGVPGLPHQSRPETPAHTVVPR